MDGVVLAYNDEKAAGVILGNDGKTYYFKKTVWPLLQNPQSGQPVSFEPKDRDVEKVLFIESSNRL